MTDIQHPSRVANPRPYEQMSEADLANAMSLGDDDPRAWAEFRTRYSLDILSFIKVFGGRDLDDDDALDCMCVVEEKILGSIHRFIPRHAGALKSWCLKIAQRATIDFLRRERQRPEQLFARPEEIEQELDRHEWWRTAGESEHEVGPRSTARTPREEEVHQALSRLAPEEQVVIDLSVNTDWTDAMIAPLVGRPKNQVRQFRARVIAKLAKILGREPPKKRKR